MEKGKTPPHGRLGSIEDILSEETPSVYQLEINCLEPYPDHPFKLYDEARLVDLVESIRKDGVLHPVVVRRLADEDYQILSGHNRVYAAKEAGLVKVPVHILEDVDDASAERIVYAANLLQRTFFELSHSEAAAIVAKAHRMLFSQGKRTDIQKHLKDLEEGDDVRYSTNAILKEQYGLNASKIAQYLRIDRLLEDIKLYLDEGRIPFTAAAMLSFLPVEAQCTLVELLRDKPGLTVSIENVKYFRTLHTKGLLTSDLMAQILLGIEDELAADEPDDDLPPKRHRRVQRGMSITLPEEIVQQYFPGQKRDEVSMQVITAIVTYFGEKRE